jgi:hypothetical protein
MGKLRLGLRSSTWGPIHKRVIMQGGVGVEPLMNFKSLAQHKNNTRKVYISIQVVLKSEHGIYG